MVHLHNFKLLVPVQIHFDPKCIFYDHLIQMQVNVHSLGTIQAKLPIMYDDTIYLLLTKAFVDPILLFHQMNHLQLQRETRLYG